LEPSYASSASSLSSPNFEIGSKRPRDSLEPSYASSASSLSSPNFEIGSKRPRDSLEPSYASSASSLSSPNFEIGSKRPRDSLEPSYASSLATASYTLLDLRELSETKEIKPTQVTSRDSEAIVASVAKRARVEMEQQTVPRVSQLEVSPQQFLTECQGLEIILPYEIAAADNDENRVNRLIQEVGRWLNKRLGMRIFMTDPKRLDDDVRQLAAASLRNLKNTVVTSNSKYACNAFTLLEKFSPSAGCLLRFLPRYNAEGKLSTNGLDLNILFFLLPSKTPRGILVSVDLIKNKLPGNFYRSLAKFINERKIPLAELNLNDREITGIAPYLHYLNCCGLFKSEKITGEHIYQFINRFPNLTELLVQGIPQLTTLPEMPLLKSLICSANPLLKTLPDLPLLTDLDCTNCKQLEKLPNMPLLKSLDCGHSFLLKTLPEMPLLESLDCGYSSLLKTLPDLPQLTELYCYCCEQLEKLPNTPLLKRLNCGTCRLLKTLPDLPQLTELYCRFCEQLEELPNMPLLKKISCDFCPLLKTPLNLLP